MPAGLGDLVYVKDGDSLSGKTVNEILAISNTALAGWGLPQGYTFGTLNSVVSNLNEAFDNGRPTAWAMGYLAVA